MKGRITAFFLIAAMLVLMAGCSGARGNGWESEPDTDTRTQMHTLEAGRTVVYRFHVENPSHWESTAITLTLFDADVEADAGNWCSARIGSAKGVGQSGSFRLFAFADGTAETARWDTSSGFNGKWRLLAPDDIGSVKSADAVLTLSRSGETIRAALNVNGAHAWDAQQTIGNLGEAPCYFYLRVEECALSGVAFSDAGAAGWIAPVWLRLLAMALIPVAAFVLHTAARRIAGERVFLVDGGLPLVCGGLVLCASLLGVLWYGHGHDFMRNLYYLPFPLPSGGTAFYIWVGLSAAGTAGLVIFLIWLAFNDLENPLRYLFSALLLGLFHAFWYLSAAIVVLQLLDQIFELVLAVFCIAGLYFLAHLYNEGIKGKTEVVTTTKIYNDIGNLVDVKYDVDYIDPPNKKGD